MSGMMVVMAGSCQAQHAGTGPCDGTRVTAVADVSLIEAVGPLDAAYQTLTSLAREYGEVWDYAIH